MLKNESFITIQGWMVNELGLKGNELLIYAIIYGFSQDTESEFTGSAQYLADWCGTSKQTVFTVLKKLVEKNLIERHENNINGVLLVNYSALPPVKKFDRGGDETSLGVVKKFDRGSQKILPHNINNNINNNNINNNINNINNNLDKEKKEKQVKEKKENPKKDTFLKFLVDMLADEYPDTAKYKKQAWIIYGITAIRFFNSFGGIDELIQKHRKSENLDAFVEQAKAMAIKEFDTADEKHQYGEEKKVMLTDAEYTKLTNLYGTIRLKYAINCLDTYLASKGTKYKSHYSVMRQGNWVWERTERYFNETTK